MSTLTKVKNKKILSELFLKLTLNHTFWERVWSTESTKRLVDLYYPYLSFSGLKGKVNLEVFKETELFYRNKVY